MTKYDMNMNNKYELKQQSESTNKTTQRSVKKPNEHAGFHFSSSMKIIDPNSGQVLLQMRCD